MQQRIAILIDNRDTSVKLTVTCSWVQMNLNAVRRHRNTQYYSEGRIKIKFTLKKLQRLQEGSSSVIAS